jgi:hypothetical protein
MQVCILSALLDTAVHLPVCFTLASVTGEVVVPLNHVQVFGTRFWGEPDVAAGPWTAVVSRKRLT